ncbi:uncharacterized protein LOC127004591 isoform X2 [Eriocheir sinensis]|uniref:uncharacterized protein LOC127004591 isoform X1 n=1 Tax=Eriocheir sinensis TaxID=95602 RepID=UPI0021C8B693|nr:uncharacterized protein LOC127004591 isoform X1 [Eriocheir sinensis]XP_050728436.1 uncharacterized protein LOC127004591 isoform X2 [Eriocheir sinensis]
MVLYQSNVVITVSLLALSTMLLVNYITNHDVNFLPWLSYDCAQECLERYFQGAPRSNDPALLEIVRQRYIFPPPRRPNTDPFDIDEPVWSKLADWNLMQQRLLQIWQGQAPGVFVEVGASDGEFMSQTLVLERNLSWTGLLVEPDPRAFAIMQQRRRNAWTSSACIHHSPPVSVRIRE